MRPPATLWIHDYHVLVKITGIERRPVSTLTVVSTAPQTTTPGSPGQGS
jgi:hypothetical protein